jgi:hypothetical protein
MQRYDGFQREKFAVLKLAVQSGASSTFEARHLGGPRARAMTNF